MSSLKIRKTNKITVFPKHYQLIILYYERADVVFQTCSGNACHATLSYKITLPSLDVLIEMHY